MDSKKTLLPALLAVSGGLAATDAQALELGEINVQSALDQPLRASIAFALQQYEQLGDYCVSVRPAFPSSGLPSINTAAVSVADGIIRLTTRSAVSEPIAALRVSVNCPYTPRLEREYTLFLDPPSLAERTADLAPAAAASRPTPSAARATSTAITTRRADPSRRSTAATPATPVDAGERYRVQPGDTLSEIAQRIDNRTVSLWTSVNEIFAANPNAFINNDPNILKAGTWITIPASARGGALSGASATTAPGVAAEAPQRSGAAAPDEPSASATYDLVTDAVQPDAAATVDDTRVLAPALSTTEAEPVPAAPPAPVSVPVASAPADSLQPGDVILDETPAADPVSTTATEPAPVGDAAEAADGSGTGSSAWAWWFGGGALTLLGGLFMFARRRTRPSTGDDKTAQVRQSPRYLEDTPEVEVVESPIPSDRVEGVDVEYDLEDDSPTEENLVIDADLEHGTGLDAGVDVDVAEDFSFAQTTELDLEFPADAAREDDVTHELEHAFGNAADEKDVPPGSRAAPDDDEYDMSVIVDATSVQDDDEVTERDLQAVVVGGIDEEEPAADSYTVSQEVDYSIIEQDYEDELSSTQALNQEIERAAANLAERMDDDDGAKSTNRMATVTPIDGTALLPRDAENDDDTAALADDETAEMPRSADEDDATAEMPSKRGKGNG